MLRSRSSSWLPGRPGRRAECAIFGVLLIAGLSWPSGRSHLDVAVDTCAATIPPGSLTDVMRAIRSRAVLRQGETRYEQLRASCEWADRPVDTIKGSVMDMFRAKTLPRHGYPRTLGTVGAAWARAIGVSTATPLLCAHPFRGDGARRDHLLELFQTELAGAVSIELGEEPVPDIVVPATCAVVLAGTSASDITVLATQASRVRLGPKEGESREAQNKAQLRHRCARPVFGN